MSPSDLRCPAVLDASTVGEFIVDLRAALAAGAVAIDGAPVGRVDAAGIQLLYSFVATARARGLAVAWSGVSPTLAAAAATLGLASAIGLPPIAIA